MTSLSDRPNIITLLTEILLIVMVFECLICLEEFGNHLVAKRELVEVAVPSIISASSIFSGLLATYLVTKILSIRNERLERLPQIDELSKKLTQFRKVLAHFGSDFFLNYNPFNRVLLQRPEFTWEQVSYTSGNYVNQISRDFWNERFSNDMSLYLAIKEIVNEHRGSIGWMYANGDHIHQRYSLDEVHTAYDISIELWNYFDHHWRSTQSFVDFNCRSLTLPMHLRPISSNATKINPLFSGRRVDQTLVAELATELYDQYLPPLIRLISRNQEPYSNQFNQLAINLLLIIIGGILIPIVIQFINFSEYLTVILSAASLSMISISMLFIGLNFFKAWKIEAEIMEH